MSKLDELRTMKAEIEGTEREIASIDGKLQEAKRDLDGKTTEELIAEIKTIDEEIKAKMEELERRYNDFTAKFDVA